MKRKKLLVIVILFYFIGIIVLKFNDVTFLDDSEHIKISDSSVSNQCYIINCSKGNLGNQIWEYMSLYVVWQRFRKFGHIPYIEEDMLNNLKTLFSNLAISTSNRINITSICNDSRGKWTILKNKPLWQYSDWFRKDSPCRDIFLDNYTTRYEDILTHSKEIKREMRFHENLVSEAQHQLRLLSRKFGLLKENVTFIGMHYRGCDYVDYLKTHYDIDPEELPDYRYYVKAMKLFKETFQHIIFIFITTDMEWLEVNQRFIENDGNVVVNPYEDDRVKDLALLSHCNHSIINYGTFGVTAAFFAGGTTYVYPLRLPLDHRGATIALGITTQLKNWHILS